MRAYIWTDQAIDTMAAVDVVEVKADALRPGMVLVDPKLMTPEFAVDHRMRSVRNSGDVRYLVADLDAGGWTELALPSRIMVKVMASRVPVAA